MNELIKITEKDGRRAVSARELHQFLENKRQFTDWIKQRIEQYWFVENQDFEVIHNFEKNPDGGRPTTEYALSIDMAKELSMVENNEKGRMARKYFIECEKKATVQPMLDDFDKKLKAASWLSSFLNLSDASKLLIAEAIAKPFGLPVPNYVPSKGVLHSASELLKRHNINMSAAKFNEQLIKQGYLEEAVRQGSVKPHKFKVITPKGLAYGENEVSPHNQKETQPHWYDSKFDELLETIGILR